MDFIKHQNYMKLAVKQEIQVERDRYIVGSRSPAGGESQSFEVSLLA